MQRVRIEAIWRGVDPDNNEVSTIETPGTDTLAAFRGRSVPVIGGKGVPIVVYLAADDPGAEAVARERKAVLRCERALQAEFPHCLIFLSAIDEPDNWGNLWEVTLWRPDCDVLTTPTARGKTPSGAASALRAKKPDMTIIGVQAADKVRGLLPFGRRRAHACKWRGSPTWGVYDKQGRELGKADDWEDAWRDAVRNLQEEARRDRS